MLHLKSIPVFIRKFATFKKYNFLLQLGYYTRTRFAILVISRSDQDVKDFVYKKLSKVP